MSYQTIGIPVEVSNTTVQINSMLHTIDEREAIIEANKDKLKKHEESFNEHNKIKSEIDELHKANKEDRKLIELLVEYIKKNYNHEFTPGSLFNQPKLEEN